MTEIEKFMFIINQNGIRKEFMESKRTQTIEYWINSYRVACKFKQFTRGRISFSQAYVYPETVKLAQENGLLPDFPNKEINNENI